MKRTRESSNRHDVTFFQLLLSTTSLQLLNPSIPLFLVSLLSKSLLLIVYSLLYCLFCVALMALNSFGLQSATLSDGRRLTTDLQSTSFMMDRMHDVRMSSDSSPLVCVSTICASKFAENFSALRMSCHPPWGFGSVVSLRKSYWPVGIVLISSRNLQLNANGERSVNSKTRFECLRWMS